MLVGTLRAGHLRPQGGPPEVLRRHLAQKRQRRPLSSPVRSQLRAARKTNLRGTGAITHVCVLPIFRPKAPSTSTEGLYKAAEEVTRFRVSKVYVVFVG